MSLQDAFTLAGKQIGLNENEQGAALQEYMANGGVNLDPATTAWCAAYVNATLKQSGMEGTGSNMARSFMEWGQAVDKPQQGDIAVFSRGDPNGPYGHVGFFDGYNDDGTIRVLGGNQGDAVSVANYSPNALLGFRRAGDQPEMGYQEPRVVAHQTQERERQFNPPQFKAQALLDPAAFQMSQNALSQAPIQQMYQNALTRYL